MSEHKHKSAIYPDLACVGYLFFKHIKILNANAISSPLTYGFPAITGFAGGIHNLSRKISQINDLAHIRLDGVLLACFDCNVQTYRENAYKDYSFIQSRNPILKSGKTAPIIEEGKCHLTLSLMVGVYSSEFFLSDDEIDSLKKNTLTLLQQQRLVGGSVVSVDKFNPVQFIEPEKINEFKTQLLPAFVLMDAHSELGEITQLLQKDNPNATALDALIETAVLHHMPTSNEKWQTQSIKKGRGWLVPVPVGYQGISPIFKAGEMANNRNPEYESQYVESIYSLGKWVFPHRIDDLAKAFWYQVYQPEQDLYLVQQNFS